MFFLLSRFEKCVYLLREKRVQKKMKPSWNVKILDSHRWYTFELGVISNTKKSDENDYAQFSCVHNVMYNTSSIIHIQLIFVVQSQRLVEKFSRIWSAFCCAFRLVSFFRAHFNWTVFDMLSSQRNKIQTIAINNTKCKRKKTTATIST